MTLTSGTRLGPYEIIAPIGAGGMGEDVNPCAKHATMVAPYESRLPDHGR